MVDTKKHTDPAVVRLDEAAAYVAGRKAHDFGYPLNQQGKLISFYKWLTGSGLNLAMINNSGDPFELDSMHIMNSLIFEQEVIRTMGSLLGFDQDELWGIVTFSGTDGNNHGIYFGSKYLERKTHKKPILYVSEEAHYSSKRLADLQNLDMVLIPTDQHGRMIPDELEKAIIPDRPALIVYAMGTTFKGGIDDMDALDAVLAKYPSVEVYRHVDAALFGGYLPFTEYSAVTDRRLHPYDSIAISGHKFFGVDEPGGFFLTTRGIRDNQNPYDVAYLDSSMPMINCSRSGLTPLKYWWIFQHTGKEEFAAQTKVMLENAAWLRDELESIGWPVWLEPMSNTVYFRRPSEGIVKKYNLASDHDDRLGGDLSHIVVMQHATRENLKEFIDELEQE